MLGLTKSPLGVDFGASSLKVLQLKGRTATAVAVQDLREQHDQDSLTRAIDAFVTRTGLKGKRAAVNTPSSHTFIRTVMFPRMPERELKDALTWEAKRQLPYAIEDAVFDYVTAESGDQVAVTFAACERSYLEEHIAPLIAAGLVIVAVDVNPLCIMRTLKYRTAGNTAVIDIGSVHTDIHIIKNGVLRLTRTVGEGEDNIKQAIMAEGRNEAEAHKLLREGSKDSLGGPLADLSLEIFRSIDFYKTTFKEAGISEIIITGSAAMNPAFREHFSEQFGVPTSVNDPFADIEMRDESMRRLGPIFSVATGLARRPQ